MILSVSRRTDIPAFYSEWFMNRLKAGFVDVRNPMNYHMISRTNLSPNNVDCIVFWSKNPKPLLPFLKEIDAMGYNYYFQFTITAYNNDMEWNVPNKTELIEVFKDLSKMIGKEKVILRYDPIFITPHEKYSPEYHIKAFTKLCDILCMHTERVVISFLDGYKKVKRNMKNIEIKELTENEMRSLTAELVKATNRNNLLLETCAEDVDLSEYGVAHSKCIDGSLIERIIGYAITNKDIKDANREHCGCMKSIDIGQYDSCIHECLYCYANINKEKTLQNYKLHDPLSSILLGEYDETNIKIRNEKDIKSFMIKDAQQQLTL